MKHSLHGIPEQALRCEYEVFEYVRLSDGQNKNWSAGGNRHGRLNRF